MLFNSYIFVLAFLPIAVAGFFWLSRVSQQAGLAWLIAASFFFYAWWDPRLLPLLLGSIAVNHLLWQAITRTTGRMQTTVLVSGIAANLGALAWFKYAATWLGAAGIFISQPVLPLGISFFTFTQIALLVDARAGRAPPPTLTGHALFVSFFPHLIAGPVLRHQDVMPQFSAETTFRISADSLAAGLAIFVIGLLKKTLLADPLSATVAAGFAHPASLTMLAAWRAAAAYSLQLYFDFSGYSDMAIGAARMLNIRFPANFDSPYKARNIIEYWQRWHISLTQYLMQYLYNPLALWLTRRRIARGAAVDRRGRASFRGFTELVAVPTTVTIVLAGVWHGSGLTFFVFGVMHAAYLVVNHAWRALGKTARAAGRSGAVWRVALTYACVLAGSVVFRAPSLQAARGVFAGMLGLHGMATHWPELREWLTLGQIVALYAIVWGAPNTQQIMHRCIPVLQAARITPARIAWRPSLPWAAAVGLGACLGVLSLGGSGEFLYFRF